MGNILEVIVEPLSNILFYFVLISYFIAFLFTVLFMVSKTILFGEISNIFFIVSAILHLLFFGLQMFGKGVFFFDCYFKVLLILSAVVVVMYIMVEIFYKIKMGGIFIILFVLIVFLSLLFQPQIPYKYIPTVSVYDNIFYILVMLGYFLFMGSQINSFSLFTAAVAYPHVIKDTLDVYLQAAKRLDTLAIIGLSVSIINRFLRFKDIDMLFFWKVVVIQVISIILIFINIRTSLLYKIFQDKKSLMGFYKILGMILWTSLLFINNMIL